MDCSHNIIEDHIDIDPDRSQQIFYCTECFTTFGHKEYIQIILYDKTKKSAEIQSKQETHQSH